MQHQDLGPSIVSRIVVSARFVTVSILAVTLVSATLACSVGKASRQPDLKDLSVLDEGTPRGIVIGELGRAASSTEKDGKRVEVYNFTQGYHPATKAGRAGFHFAADVFTLGLWELLADPIEETYAGTEMSAVVTYDEKDHVETSVVREGHYVVTEDRPEAEEEEEMVVLLPGLPTQVPRLDPGTTHVDWEDATYYNTTYECSLRFPNPEGWQLLTEKWELANLHPLVIFAANNPARLLNLFLVLEEMGVEMSMEDNQLAEEQSLRVLIQNARRPIGFKQVSLEQTTVNGHEALIWTYELDFKREGRAHMWTRAFFLKGTQHYQVQILTVPKAYERRKEEIHSIINTFDFLATAKKSA